MLVTTDLGPTRYYVMTKYDSVLSGIKQVTLRTVIRVITATTDIRTSIASLMALSHYKILDEVIQPISFISVYEN